MKMVTVKKSVFLDCIRRELSASLPEKNRQKNFHKHPLFAWLIGAYKIKGKSPIECVVDNQTRWPWTRLCDSGYYFVERVLKKKSNLSPLQKRMLYNYVQRRFPGHYRGSNYEYGLHSILDICIDDKAKARLAYMNLNDFFDKCIVSAGLDGKEIPLRLILSTELTCLLNLKFMEFYL